MIVLKIYVPLTLLIKKKNQLFFLFNFFFHFQKGGLGIGPYPHINISLDLYYTIKFFTLFFLTKPTYKKLFTLSDG